MQNLHTIEKVFSDRIFKIPDYQRGYAWESRQIQDFLEDIELIDEYGEHFYGMVILHPSGNGSSHLYDEEGRRYEIFDIVDGQQRLTTVVILLTTLHEELLKYRELSTLANGLKKTFIVVDDENHQPLQKLSLNKDCAHYFTRNILGQRDSIEGFNIRSHRLLEEAKQQIKEYLSRMKEEHESKFPQWLKQLHRKTTQQLKILLYKVDKGADAWVIFETMNNRGQPITELEKVKNYLLYVAAKLNLPVDHELPEVINETWTFIFESLMRAGLGRVEYEDQFLRAHWIMAYEYDTRKWEGSRSIKDRFDLYKYSGLDKELLEDILQYLYSLKDAVIAYCDIFRPGRSDAFESFRLDAGSKHRMQESGKRLVRLGAVATFLPLLMSLRLSKSGNPDLYGEALDISERFAFRVYSWTGRPSHSGQSRIFRLGYDVFQGADIIAVLDELQRLIIHYSSNEHFKERFTAEKHNWFHWSGLKYFLYEYERYLADEAGKAVLMPWETITKKKDTIEHIMPQTPDSEGFWESRFDPDQYDRWINDIGNLTLTL